MIGYCIIARIGDQHPEMNMVFTVEKYRDDVVSAHYGNSRFNHFRKASEIKENRIDSNEEVAHLEH